jgi:hypothetical protein
VDGDLVARRLYFEYCHNEECPCGGLGFHIEALPLHDYTMMRSQMVRVGNRKGDSVSLISEWDNGATSTNLRETLSKIDRREAEHRVPTDLGTTYTPLPVGGE